MAQKVNKPAPAPTVITVTLPEEDKLLRTGQILIQRGTLATLRQFEYTSLEDIMTAIQDSADWLMQVEEDPPDVTPAASTPRPQSADTLSQPASAEPNEAETAEQPKVAQDEPPEAQDQPQSARVPEGAPGDQPALF